MTTSPELIKLVGACLIGVLALGGGLLPALLKSRGRARNFFPLSNAFAGGVFLGAGLLHMLPHAAETFNHIASSHAGGAHVHAYPWAFLLAGAGFLLILLIEKIIPSSRAFDEPRMVVEAHSGCIAMPTHAAYPGILLIALSAHSIFAGIALGTSVSITDTLAIFIAIAAHKGTEAFALGATLTRSDYSVAKVRKLILIFALMTPVGVLLGLAFTHALSGDIRSIAEASFNALAAGTFLYIASLDILNEEFQQPALRWPKFALVLLGFAAMALLAAYEMH